MTERPSDVQELFDALADEPPQDGGGISFRSAWSRAERQQELRRSRRRSLRFAVVLSAVSFLVVATLVWNSDRLGRTSGSPSSGLEANFEENFEANFESWEMARSLSEWQTPLDFLLETPGGKLLGLGADGRYLSIPTELAMGELEETL